MGAIVWIPESLDYVGGTIDRLNKDFGLGLVRHGRRGKVAVWSVVDALFKAVEIGAETCEVEVINFKRNPMGLESATEAVWRQLTEGLFETYPASRYAGSNRQAARALAHVPPHPYFVEERSSWEKGREKRANLTVEEAVEEALPDAGVMAGKPGPKPKNRKEKVEARGKWDERSGESASLNFAEWSEQMFGLRPDGSLEVPYSTFKSWCPQCGRTGCDHRRSSSKNSSVT